MLTKSLAIALLATAIVGGVAIDRAEAVVAGPGTVESAIPADETVLNARWVCDQNQSRCHWHPWWPGMNDGWGTQWGPPRSPGCFWEKRRGAWRNVCPH